MMNLVFLVPRINYASLNFVHLADLGKSTVGRANIPTSGEDHRSGSGILDVRIPQDQWKITTFVASCLTPLKERERVSTVDGIPNFLQVAMEFR